MALAMVVVIGLRHAELPKKEKEATSVGAHVCCDPVKMG